MSILNNISFFSIMGLDAAQAWDVYFQESASPFMDGLVNLHDSIGYYLILVLTAILWITIVILMDSYIPKNSEPFTNSNQRLPLKSSLKYLVHGSVIEVVWTLSPAIILVAIAFPSFKLLYLMDSLVHPSITLKAIGRQWYWTYEYSDTLDLAASAISEGESIATTGADETKVGQSAITFDSYLVPTDSLEPGDLRMLEVDNRTVLPVDTMIRVIVTGGDVMHSWAVPSLGIKMDAIPGRLNQTALDINRKGFFYGQCSELCGVNHGFMPIVIQSVSLESYIAWLASF